MLIFVTLAFTAMAGIMGLAVDLGFVTFERRTLQRAADAAAMSGAIDLINPTDWNSINIDVASMVTRNTVPAGTTTACTLVDNSNTQVQANCNPPTNANTSGVRVELSRTRDNYFMGLLGMSTTNISASAIGRVVQNLSYDAGDVPFIVCGYQTSLDPNGQMDIILPGGPPYVVNPVAVGRTFVIHGPQVSKCGGETSFKGLSDRPANAGVTTMPATLSYTTGTVAGPTTRLVNGPDGCPPGVDDDCIMLVPVAVSNVGPPSDQRMQAVTWLPFMINDEGANKHTGTLISASYLLKLDTTNTGNWTISGNGIATARMVN